MLPYQLNMLRHFYKDEKDLYGNPVDYYQYDFQTMQELDRLRTEIGSRCLLIRGSHGLYKETAVDAIFPQATFSTVVMALFRSGLSKGVYQGGSIHLDSRMAPNGLARSWMAFKPSMYESLAKKGLGHLRTYTNSGWDYYAWGEPDSFRLLTELVAINP